MYDLFLLGFKFPAHQTLAPALELSGSNGIFGLSVKSSGYKCKKHAWFLPSPALNGIKFSMSFVCRSMCRRRAIQFIMAVLVRVQIDPSSKLYPVLELREGETDLIPYIENVICIFVNKFLYH